MTANSFLNVHEIVEGSNLYGRTRSAFVISVQGCSLGCRGCVVPQTHSTDACRLMTVDDLVERVRDASDCGLLVLLGGEPFEQPEALAELVERVRARRADYGVICYSGYTREHLLAGPGPRRRLLDQVDVLIDGPYVARLRCRNDPLRGSSNQRIHFLTDRISPDELSSEGPREFEVTVRKGGEMVFSGFIDADDLEAVCRSLEEETGLAIRRPGAPGAAGQDEPRRDLCLKKLVSNDPAEWREAMVVIKAMAIKLWKHLGASDVDDVVAEAACRVCERLHSFRSESRVTTWIHKIVWHVGQERKRKKIREGHPLNLYPEPASRGPDPSKWELSAVVPRCIEELQENHRTAVELYYLEGLSIREIAERLGVPKGTVQSWLYQARQRLRAMIAKLLLLEPGEFPWS